MYVRVYIINTYIYIRFMKMEEKCECNLANIKRIRDIRI